LKGNQFICQFTQPYCTFQYTAKAYFGKSNYADFTLITNENSVVG